MAALFKFLVVSGLKFGTQQARAWTEFEEIPPLQDGQLKREAIAALGFNFREIQIMLYDVNSRLREYEDAQRAYRAAVAEGDLLQTERELFRQRTAAIIQGYRTRDAAFRIFRNEKLERYKTLFDLAATYSFLAAKAYDYETGLLHTPEGQEFVSRIVAARALGVVHEGEPQFAGSDTGDPGLSSALAEMKADWDVLRGRLGFNNPDDYGTTFSLRTENYRILPGSDGDTAWKDILSQGRRVNLLEDSDIRRYALQIDNGDGLPVPGIVLEFSTVIADGLNFFGHPLAPGDRSFSPASFATKIYSAGVSLEGYVGMDVPASFPGVTGIPGEFSAEPNVSFFDPVGLAATPFVYLIPAGLDSMRSPPLGDVSVIRTWNVDEVTIPLPFNIGASEFSTKTLFQSADSLSEPIFEIRKHQPFRPVPSSHFFDQGIFDGLGGLVPSPFTSSRLIGRSVWNSQWKLVIPGRTLLHDPEEGLDRLIRSLEDVRLHLETYSYSGN